MFILGKYAMPVHIYVIRIKAILKKEVLDEGNQISSIQDKGIKESKYW